MEVWMTEGPRVLNKQVEFNPFIYTLSKLSRFGYEINVFKYTIGRYSEQPPEQPAHTSRQQLHGKMDVKIFLIFHRSRKHWECKYYVMLHYMFTLLCTCTVRRPLWGIYSLWLIEPHSLTKEFHFISSLLNRMRKWLHIWHVYSTYDALSNYTKTNDLVTLHLAFVLT